MSDIKTLAQILADMDTPSISTNPSKHAKTCTVKPPAQTAPSCPPAPNQADTMGDKRLAQILSSVPTEHTDNSKQTQRLRWLAFYYLSRRELSQQELRQKLLAKDQDPKQVELLLSEFASKGYQSDERCAYMLIREAIRRGRGKQHIAKSLRQHGINPSDTLDELIKKADVDSLCDGTILDTDDKEDVNWLKLAVEARSKKYGDTPPKDPKDKARQLRFLQYRGFDMAVCFDALKLTLADFDD